MEISDFAVAVTQLVLLLVFANRYFVGAFLKRVKGHHFDEARDDYEPTVTIIVPMFNEGEGIYRTIHSLAAQDYCREKLSIIIVDDCSTDDSYTWACRGAAEYDHVRVIKNPENMGKRKGIIRAVRQTDSEIVVSVDSDVVIQEDAVWQLVRRFVRPEIAAVGGRVNLINRNDNWLTQLQAVKYFFGYEYLKNIENAFNSVMCLSGCLTAYRREVLVELEPILDDRSICGIPIKYGEDRFLTRQIVRAGYQTTMTLDAVSYTVAPNTLSKYFSQQLRWRRSNIVDYMGGLTHAWNLHPFVAIHYLGLFAMLMTYPLAIIHSVLGGNFVPMVALHIAGLAIFTGIYQIHAWSLPKEQRVHPFAFLGMVLVMPVTYIVLTPLAMFTLDSGSWETRGHHEGGVQDDAVTPTPQPVLLAGGTYGNSEGGKVVPLSDYRAARQLVATELVAELAEPRVRVAAGQHN